MTYISGLECIFCFIYYISKSNPHYPQKAVWLDWWTLWTVHHLANRQPVLHQLEILLHQSAEPLSASSTSYKVALATFTCLNATSQVVCFEIYAFP
jgi:hypothetical protein